MTLHWQTTLHINAGDQFIRVDRCPELGFNRQTVTLKKGYRVVEQFCFFDNETQPDDPIYTLAEILTEARYREAIRQEGGDAQP